MQAKQKDKQAVGQLEKRLKAEQEARATAEKQLADEKKRKKLEEATAARAVALAAASRYTRPHTLHTGGLSSWRKHCGAPPARMEI